MTTLITSSKDDYKMMIIRQQRHAWLRRYWYVKWLWHDINDDNWRLQGDDNEAAARCLAGGVELTTGAQSSGDGQALTTPHHHHLPSHHIHLTHLNFTLSISTHCSINSSSQFSVPNWKLIYSQSEMLFHESKINLKKIGWFKGVFIFVIEIGEE